MKDSISVTNKIYAFLNQLTRAHKAAVWNTLGCFIIGSIILIIYLLTLNDDVITVGIYYVAVAFGWNVIVLFYVILSALRNKTSVKQTLLTIAIMLLNIPIAFLYFIIVLEFAL